MDVAQGINFLAFGGLAVIALLSVFVWDKRYRKGRRDIPPGYERTEEVFIDPVDGDKVRVYYNPKTGERFYRHEG